MDEHKDFSERTLIRVQVHTLRERLHVLERRLRDMEFAQEVGAIRGDIHAEAIADISKAIARIEEDLDAVKVP